jgi:hydroxyacyl-ACP dehydratase HTD2-like protein with hotdog domain
MSENKIRERPTRSFLFFSMNPLHCSTTFTVAGAAGSLGAELDVLLL